MDCGADTKGSLMLVQRAFENPSKGQEIILLYCSLSLFHI